MRLENLNKSTVRPVEFKHICDNDINVHSKQVYSSDGLVLKTNDLFSNPTDSKVIDGTSWTMTDKKRVKELLRLDVGNNQTIYPYTFVTYLVFSSKANDLYDPRAGVAAYPTNNNPQFLQIEELPVTSGSTRSYTISSPGVYESVFDTGNRVQSNNLFEIELIDSTYCRIHHNDDYFRSSLTYTDMSNFTSSCVFSATDNVPLSALTPEHPQVFSYQLDDRVGYIGFIKTLDNGDRTMIIHSGESDDLGNMLGGQLSGLDPSIITDEVWNIKSLSKIRPRSLIDTSSVVQRSLDTMFYKYSLFNSRGLYQYTNYNSVNVDETVGDVYQTGVNWYTASHVQLYNNFLIDCQYIDSDNDTMLYNITPLKNQLTPRGDQIENNPHAVGDLGEFCISMSDRKNTDIRTYQKIFNGTNQHKSDDNMCLGYTSYVDKIILKSDNVTYFHLPYMMKPYTWMNINYRRVPDQYPENYPAWQKLPIATPGSREFDYEDFVGLIRAGAIPGSSPMDSDKIFKKRAGYRYNTNWGDSGLEGNRGIEGDNHYGTWLCSWLQSAPDDSGEKQFGPIWMDRYYDDTRFSENQVLNKPANCISDPYTETGILERANPSQGYFDIPSELRLERGVLYAYHHIGQKNTRDIIQAFSRYMFQDGIDNFSQVVSGQETAANAIESNEYSVYDFTGDKYGTTSPPETPGDFRISFWMKSDDWSKGFGHQIMGNFMKEGMAIVNDDSITPLLICQQENQHSTDRINLINTGGEIITTIDSSSYIDSQTSTLTNNKTHVLRETALGDITIAVSKPTYCNVSRYNINGANTDSFVVSGGLFNRTSQIKKMHQIYEYGFTLFDGMSSIGRIDLRNGNYLDLDTADFEAIAVSGVVTNGRYNQIYTLNYDLPPVNGKPVYTSQVAATTYYMFNSGSDQSTWVISTKNDPYDLDENKVYSIGKEPSIWNYTNTSARSDDGDKYGSSDIFYGDYRPPPVYLSPTLNQNNYTSHSNWNDIYIVNSKSLFVIDGHGVCVSRPLLEGGTGLLYFIDQNSVYIHNTLDISERFYNVGVPIINHPGVEQIKIDQDNCLWLRSGGTITKYDQNYQVIFSVNIIEDSIDESNHDIFTTASFNMDLINEYVVNSEQKQYCLVLIKTESTVYIAKIDSIGTVFEFYEPVDGSGYVDCVEYTNNKNYSFSNFDNVSRVYKKKNNNLTFKYRVKNKYRQSDYIDVSETFDVSTLQPGWHHFSFGFDASLKGIGYFYIDGLLASERRLLTDNEYGKFSFIDVLSKISLVGATQSYNNELLSNFLNQPGFYYIKNASIKSLKMYNFNLYREYVKALSREHIKTPDLHWSIPSGRRSHLDHVDKYHVHHLPISKSSEIDVSIINTGLTGSQIDTVLPEINNVVYEFAPALTTSTVTWLEQPNTNSVLSNLITNYYK
jgi:hypothetical protein